jgi:inner membrane protein
MPSPIGHAIAGVAAGWLVSGAPRSKQRWREACLFGALGASPDLDLLVGAHSGPTHGIGAAALVGVIALVIPRLSGPDDRSVIVRGSAVFALACAAAYGSHILLDWLARDSTPPIGIMALWPLTRAHYESDLHLFMAISRRYHQGWIFIRQNALALLRELLILIPGLIAVMRLRPRPQRRMDET